MLPLHAPASAVLDELGQAAHAASLAYRDSLAKFRETWRGYGGLSKESTERYAREDFEGTPEGAALAEACLDAMRRHNAARDLSDHVNLGGTRFAMSELTPEGRDAVYAAAAEHGNVDRWPADVRDSVLALLKASRTVSYSAAAEKRRMVLAREAQTAAARVVEARGGDPTAWSEEDLDEVGRAASRLAAFDQLVSRACAVDVEWGKRRTKENGQ